MNFGCRVVGEGFRWLEFMEVEVPMVEDLSRSTELAVDVLRLREERRIMCGKFRFILSNTMRRAKSSKARANSGMLGWAQKLERAREPYRDQMG